MKKKLSNKVYVALNVPFMIVLVGVMIALIVVASSWSEVISIFMHGYGFNVNERSAEIVEEGRALGEEIVDEGIVLLKNDREADSDRSALPLSADEIKKVNVFGWASIDWIAGGYGSGFSNTSLTKMKFYEALDEADIEYNTELHDMYMRFFAQSATDYGKTWDEKRGDISIPGTKKFRLHEPGAAYYTDEVINNAREFSDVAIVVLGRVGGEGKDLRAYQTKQPQKDGSDEEITVTDRHYLEISTEEEEMLRAANEACDKVIVLLNTCNAMELGFLDDPQFGVDACMLVGTTGLTGVRSVIGALKGDVVPSGRTVDTYAYDFTKSPSFVTSTDQGVLSYTNGGGGEWNPYSWYVDYTDDIYIGYKYYETAYAEKEEEQAGSGETWYEENVQFPFGYGLSYTDFEWTVKSVTPAAGSVLPKDGKIVVEVEVRNTGNYSGKDVVELYYSAHYIDNGIEKSHVVLGAFAKTKELEPYSVSGDTDTVTLELYVQDMASYDAYGKNAGTHTGYELDAGSYSIMLMNNAHELDDCANAETVYTINETYEYDNDRTNPDGVIKNRFTGDDVYEGNVPIDGSEETVKPTYLSRSNFDGTFPSERKPARAATEEELAISKDDGASEESGVEKHTQGKKGELTVQDMLGVDYDDEKWDQLLDQVTYAEMTELITTAAFKTAEVKSVKKPSVVDLDGPTGLNTREAGDKNSSFVAYPNETLLAQTWNVELAYDMGRLVGEEGRNAGVWGWYAPSANMHRSPFGGRNYEYYSEDPLISGMFAGYTVKGAKDMGMYSYLKHFAVNENETHREGLFVWLTEQNLRENYLKAFEIALKISDGNAVMTSMNRIGATWAGGSKALLTDILRQEWGFEGSVVTDWVGNYMPVNLGLKAGNDIWLHRTGLNHADAKSDTYYHYARQATKNVLFTYVDTEQARLDNGGEPVDITKNAVSLSYGWVWIIVAVEVVFAAGLGVWIFFVIRRVRKANKAEV